MGYRGEKYWLIEIDKKSVISIESRKKHKNSTFRHRFGANCVSIVYLRSMF